MEGPIGETRRLEIDYAPLPSQRRFHDCRARFKGFSGPIGSGKSQALCQEAIRLSYLNPGRQGLIGAPTYPMLRDATLTSFLEVLGSNGIRHQLNKSELVLVMKDTRSRIYFRAVDDFERLRGTNLAWFGLDELTYTAEEAWLRLEGRLRDPLAKQLCGFGVWTPKGFDWVYRRFIREPVEGYAVVLAQPYENRHVLDRIPDFYTRLKQSYDARFFEQEVLGDYLNVQAGVVYREFKRARNVKEVKVDGMLPLLWALDFNVDPMSSVVAQKNGEDVLVLDEIVLSRAGTAEACEEFHTRYPNHQAGIVVYGDASGQRLQTAGTTDYQIIKEFFRQSAYRGARFRVPASNPSVRERVALVNAKLFSASEEIHLLVHPRCKELISDFEEVTYKPESSVIDKDKDPKRTHLSDALGYLIWQECRPKATFGEQSRRLI
ncbi:MAG TPA: phage terminase large subunit [Bryobacteraceae bacterium]|nr:phage terminase large subunit [Bryobacteraceae bacterium]